MTLTSYIDDEGITEDEFNNVLNDSSLENDFQKFVRETDGDEVVAKMTLPNGKIVEAKKGTE